MIGDPRPSAGDRIGANHGTSPMPREPLRLGGTDSREKEKTPALIRTMRSDIAEFLKTAKPALFERTVRQSELPRGIRKTPLALKIFGVLIILGVLAGGGFLAYQILTPPPPPPAPPPPPPPPPAPQPFLFFESSQEVFSLRAGHELAGALAVARHSALPGEFHRIVLRIPDEAGTRQIPEAREFFSLIGATPPEDFLLTLTQPPQFFAYSGAQSAPALGILLSTSDPPGASRALARWEPRLAEELSPIIAASPAGAAATTSLTFSSASYRNISYRFRALEPDQDRGLGYFAFPAQNLIVIAASEETLRRTIDRMFEGG